MKTVLEYLPVRHWLMKTEPDVFSIDDLFEKGEGFWDGVRNYLARNFMKDHMQVGDKVLFYHSNANPSGIVGTARVKEAAKPDHTAWDKKSEYYDPKSSKEKPRWFAITLAPEQKFKKTVTLDALRGEKSLKEMLLLRKGQRLSILPLTQDEYETIVKIGSL